MRRAVIVASTVVVLALAQAASAANLQAGWYASMYSMQYYAYDRNGLPQLLGSGEFQTVPGQYGPFTLTDGPFHWSRSREVEVLSSVTGVGSRASLVLPVAGGLDSSQCLAYVEFGWRTNYDPSQMRLELWHNKMEGSAELLWQQILAGTRTGYSNAAYDSTYEKGLFFRVAVVPEPSGFASLLASALAATYGITRRRQR